MTAKDPTSSSNIFDYDASRSTLSRSDRYRRVFDEYVRAPITILWEDWRAKAGLVITSLYLIMGIVGPMVIPNPYPNQAERYILAFQDLSYVFGTDGRGQDLLGLVVHATPDMLIMIGAGAVFSTVVATVIGIVAGYDRGRLDQILMTITDATIAIPGLIIVIVLAAIIEPRNPVIFGILLASHVWSGIARSIRSQVLSLREESYVEASQVVGLSTSTILFRDLLPNVMPYVLINFVNSARNVIFSSVALYFLGVLPWTNANWGVILNQAYNSPALVSVKYIHYLVVPIATIVFFSLGLILLSQGFDRIFNPRIRARHAKSVPDESENSP